MITLKGMTWEHRRAVDPLRATLAGFQTRHPGIDVEWASRPLAGFEFEPVGELARRYDLIIFDHPFVGEVAEQGCLRPLDDIVTGAEASFIGPSLATYHYGGAIWGLPVDAACQVAVSRPDLMARLKADVPRTWDEVLRLGEMAASHGLRLAIGLEGVHALMTFFTLMAGMGTPCAVDPGEPFCDRAAARDALQRLRNLVDLCPPEIFTWSSIGLHEAMATRDDLVYCPAVYCYATYAEADRVRPLRFHDLPGVNDRVPRGSTIGGTGLGIAASCRHPEAALAYARYLMEPSTQAAFAAHHGQPARIECWHDPDIDARFGGGFSATRTTMELAWTRPRYAGYLTFQAKAGPLVERHLRGELTAELLLNQLEALHHVRA